jgi:hypothetical protein
MEVTMASKQCTWVRPAVEIVEKARTSIYGVIEVAKKNDPKSVRILKLATNVVALLANLVIALEAEEKGCAR